MVVGTTFVWAHLPKTGGDSVAAMFALFPELVERIDPAEDPRKHRRFTELIGADAEKERAMNIRRLPAWILSHALHRARHGVEPHYRPLPVESPYEMSLSQAPDRLLGVFLGGDADPGAVHWLRTEQLADDFLAFVARYGAVDDDRRSAVEELSPRNAATYDRPLEHWFTGDHIRHMYESNPKWAAVERAVYGDLLS